MYIFADVAVAVVKEEDEKEGKKTIDIGKEAAIEAEVRAARERAIVPLETRIKSFRDMLAEKEVSFLLLIKMEKVMVYCTEKIPFRSLRLALGRRSFTRLFSTHVIYC